MNNRFDGAALRLARTYQSLSLESVAERVDRSRQFIHKLETGQSKPTEEMIEALAEAVNVLPSFFSLSDTLGIGEEQFHFRKLRTIRVSERNLAIAKGEIFRRVVEYLDRALKLPPVNFPEVPDIDGPLDIEKAAETCRAEWGLGNGPISNMIRLAENSGSVVTTFRGVSSEIDALSVETSRPVIVINEAKESPCRQRFDIGHEIGHFVMHSGRVTGDRQTESEANRFSGALLVPRTMMAKLFPRPRGGRLDWRGISEFKLTWGVSKAALLYRARQLGIIDDRQYRSGVITLNRGGEAINEREDHLLTKEQPELLARGLRVLASKAGINLVDIAASLGVRPSFLEDVLPVGYVSPDDPKGSNKIVSFAAYRERA